MGSLGFIDVAIVVAYMMTCLGIGFYKSSQIKNIKEYAVGNRDFSTLVMVSTLLATHVSASRIGEVSGIYTYGLLFGLPLLLVPLNWLIVKQFYAKNIWRFKGCISISEVMYQLYGDVGRYASNIASCMTGVGLLTVQAVAIGLLLEYFFVISYFNGVIIGMGVITVYSALGGIRAVAFTDVFQFLIFFVVLPIACGYSFYQVGSFEKLISALPSSHLTLLDSNGSILTFCGYIFFYVLMPIVSGPYMQRLLMSKDYKQLNKSYNILILAYIIFACVFTLIAFTIKVLYPDIQSKYAFYHYIAHLPSVLVGLMIAGVLAIVMSSADSWLNTVGVIVVNDVFKKQLLKKTDKQRLFIAKMATCLCSVLAVALANMNEQEIFRLNMLAFIYAVPLYFIPMTAGFLGFKSNSKTFIISIVFSFMGIFIGRYQFNEFNNTGGIYSMIASTIGFFGAHYYQFPGELKECFVRIKKKINNWQTRLWQLPQNMLYRLTHFNAIGQGDNTGYFYGFTFLFILLNVPVFMFGFDNVNAGSEIMIVRSIASVLCIFMCLSEHWLNNADKRQIFAYMVVTFCLPFLSSYSFIASNYEIVWSFNLIISILLFYILIPSRNFIPLIIVGALLGYVIGVYPAAMFSSGYKLIGLYSASILAMFIMATLYYINIMDKRERLSLKMLGQSIAHDVGAPLSMGIINADIVADMLKKKEYKSAEKYIKELRQNTELAMQDVQVMLGAMSADVTCQPIDWGIYSISKYVLDAVGNYHMNEHQRKRLTVDLQGDFEFEGSPTLLRHMVNNLLKNALKYAGEYAHIDIFINAEKRTLHVKDDGCGISKKVKEKIFEKYMTTRGHGIGLSFCKEAMHLMQGEIKFISEEKKGTEFILSF